MLRIISLTSKFWIVCILQRRGCMLQLQFNKTWKDDNNGAATANLQAASSFACVGSESIDTDGDANKAALPGAPTDNNGDITMTA